MSRSRISPLTRTLLALTIAFALAPLVLASSGDRNPTFQHCLKGCIITYCDPSQPLIAWWLRAAGWTCQDNCKYSCGHAFTDNIRTGSRYHQFYGKWAFYRLGPIQEPMSVLLSLGNLYVHLQGLKEVRRRVRKENRLRPWLISLALVQINTWIWSAVFHSRDTPFTERLDYFSATLTIALSLLYTVVRVFLLQTPLSSSKRFLFPAVATIAFLVITHFTYLLSFPPGQFPYGYHTRFNVLLGMAHNLIWVAWSLSFKYPFPSFKGLKFPLPYPPRNPLDTAAAAPGGGGGRPKDAMTPLSLVLLTCFAMGFELLDFAPWARILDAHAMWHAATIPLGMAWWTFLCNDAIELEGSLLSGAGGAGGARGGGGAGKMPLTGTGISGATLAGEVVHEPQPQAPGYIQVASGGAGRATKSPGRNEKERPE